LLRLLTAAWPDSDFLSCSFSRGYQGHSGHQSREIRAAEPQAIKYALDLPAEGIEILEIPLSPARLWELLAPLR
jgi:hypothetical protein